MAYRQAAKAAGRWPADAATATLASPTATGPIRWAIATRAREARLGLVADRLELGVRELLVGLEPQLDDLVQGRLAPGGAEEARRAAVVGVADRGDQGREVEGLGGEGDHPPDTGRTSATSSPSRRVAPGRVHSWFRA